ncbi:MAG: nuclear transport factor 2 family protein [Chitinophagales bacterium]
MKNMIVKGILSGCIISMVIACNDKKEEAATATIDKEQIKKDIQAKEDEFAALYNSGELKNIGYYADSAASYYPNRAPLIGKPAIIEYLKADLESNTDKISFKTNEVFVTGDGNQVLEIGYFKVVDSANNPINTGNYMSLFEKRNGKYVCLRDMSTSDSPVK